MYGPTGSTHQYLDTQVQASSAVERIVLLFEAALRAIADAQDGFDRRDIAARGQAISRALAIVTELQCSLDLEQGGDIANELDRLYHWMNGRLVDATTQQSSQPLGEVRKVLLILADGWREVASRRESP